MDEILEQFISESRDNLAYIDKHLEELKDGDEEVINALFRAAHTLKGGAGLVGAVAIKELTHSAEDLLDAYRQGKIEYSSEMIDTMYDAFDEVVELIDAVDEMGDVNIEVDDDKIDSLKTEVRNFIFNDKQEVQTESFSTILNIDKSLNVEKFNLFQIQKLAKKLPLKVELNEEFTKNNNYWIVNFDLDSETLILGNDPVYLFSLLENQNFFTEVKCNGIDETNLLEWKSLIIGAINSNESEFEDVFYNILDELTFRPLSIEVLFECDYDSVESDAFNEFKDELNELYNQKEFNELDEKVSALLQVINSKSKEGFILSRLQAVITNYDIKSDNYINVLNIALSKLGIEISETKKVENQEVKETTKSSTETIKLDDKVKANILNILNTQLKVLKVANDDNVMNRTKLLLKNVLGFLKLNNHIDEIESLDELKDFINKIIDKVNSNESDEPVKKEQPKEVKKVEKKPTPKATPKQVTPAHPKEEKKATPKVVKIEQSQIDDLMDIVGEILVVKNAIPYIADNLSVNNIDNSKRELSGKYEEISRIIEQLQDRVMKMRLLPLEYIFGRYPKLVRDISKKLGKKIKYVEKGGDTKLDKNMIEKLADPLVHIIRNSLDHGIETPEVRLEKGKPEEGILEISAKSEGDKVFIVIKDDGAGINLEKVVHKVLEKALISPELLDKMSREEKLKLIFLPGLSTNEEITELSGRGVGTDALKKTIEELGGKIKLISNPDKGTELTLELPVSMALTNVFHIMMNKINYAIAMDYIVETVKVLKEDIQTANHKPFINIRGELIPLLFSEFLLGNSEISDENSIVIVTVANKKVGLVVDEFVGQLDVVQKPLSGAIKNHPLITGTSLLGNGDVLFVLDVKKLIGTEDER